MAKIKQLTDVLMPPVTLNEGSRLYVIPSRHDGKLSYSCYGFDVLFDKVGKLAAWLSLPAPTEDLRGTLPLYQVWEELQRRGSARCEKEVTRCPIELTPQLIGLEGKRVQVVTSFGETLRFQVGKSMGWMPCHLEIQAHRLHEPTGEWDADDGDKSGGPAVMGAPFKSIQVLADTKQRRLA